MKRKLKVEEIERKAEAFNDRMNDLFHRTPGCWYGNMPKIQADGGVSTHGNMAVDPDMAAIAVQCIARNFNLFPGLELGEPEVSGQRAILVRFYLKAEDEARALIAGIPLRNKAEAYQTTL